MTASPADASLLLDTALAPQGAVYARLCALGYASSDYEYTFSGDGCLITVAGQAYRLNDAGELIPLEG